jgi:hypothetical protein
MKTLGQDSRMARTRSEPDTMHEIQKRHCQAHVFHSRVLSSDLYLYLYHGGAWFDT